MEDFALFFLFFGISLQKNIFCFPLTSWNYGLCQSFWVHQCHFNAELYFMREYFKLWILNLWILKNVYIVADKEAYMHRVTHTQMLITVDTEFSQFRIWADSATSLSPSRDSGNNRRLELFQIFEVMSSLLFLYLFLYMNIWLFTDLFL